MARPNRLCDDDHGHEVLNSPVIQLGKRLTHEYMVDQWAKIECQRLDFHKHNQSKIRAELYSGLADAVSRGDVDVGERAANVGRPVILPSSFTGGPRYMHQLYQDAMAIVRVLGKPDLFITLTCNADSPEITRNLLPNQRPNDRPDLIARVFRQKFDALMHDLIHRGWPFGKVVAHVHTIEFQKRGLPHAHILLWLDEHDKLRSCDDYDNFISAELPDKYAEPDLWKIVTKFQIHGPCGSLVPDPSKCPCMESGVCSKRFPKEFCEVTRDSADGYPVYRRRDDGRFVEKRVAPGPSGVVRLDNRWVVPYNRLLSLKYNCHLNVEYCASIKSVKYLHKYVYKGHDRAMIEISAPATTNTSTSAPLMQGASTSLRLGLQQPLCLIV
jgi:hypothetical protein